MKNKVSVLDSALFYHKAIEYCSAMVPISLQEILSSINDGSSEATTEEDKQYNMYLSTAVAAAAISTATSYHTTPVHYSIDPAELMHGYASLDQRQQQRTTFTTSSAAADAPQEVQIDNAHQWCAAATHRGRLPLCFLEAGFPGILKNREKLPSTVAYDGLPQYLIDAFDTAKYPHRAAKSHYLRTVNPFTVSLSPVPFAYRSQGKDEDGRQVVAKLKDFPYSRAFTNLLSVRGCSGDALREGLYTQCRSHPYRISSCQLNAAPLYVATSSPFHNDEEDDHVAEHAHPHNNHHNHNNNHQEDDDNTYTNPYHQDSTGADQAATTSSGSCVELVTAVHASPLVGAYLAQQTSLWRAACGLQSVAVQLDKAGLDRTECKEIEEQLQELAQRYEL
uniref:Uncharacterized protein n=2 Tax=Spumella elongata TaxID=89044 RepID=A0A7S3H5H8_9STRA|mmetsp:Transcript_35799/g.61594  ORF Transcript_35799/g.61594 Transcript_35799/m.61594 type:complete len:392 (+) Transcript_35799:703-1878(+)